jgi:uncharacterized damage-inducible protein DinB
MHPREIQILHSTTALRTHLLELLTDEDLAFRLPHNPSLGELCRIMGDVQRSYIDSFKTLKQVWDVKNTEVGIETSVARLQAWYQALDEELIAVLTALPAEDFETKSVERGFPMPLGAQFHTYREALLIFCGKCSVYLQAMGKPLNQQWQDWIG